VFAVSEAQMVVTQHQVCNSRVSLALGQISPINWVHFTTWVPYATLTLTTRVAPTCLGMATLTQTIPNNNAAT